VDQAIARRAVKREVLDKRGSLRSPSGNLLDIHRGGEMPIRLLMPLLALLLAAAAPPELDDPNIEGWIWGQAQAGQVADWDPGCFLQPSFGGNRNNNPQLLGWPFSGG
jgi:hypothetical protein